MTSQDKGKAFTNHRYNGVYLEFPNGNAISTIWGCGTYSDNHDKSPLEFNKIIREGSNTAEILLYTDFGV